MLVLIEMLFVILFHQKINNDIRFNLKAIFEVLMFAVNIEII